MASVQPTLAVVLPVFKHPGLVVEALHSALADPNVVVVAVNDGCPFSQTDVVLGEFALAEPRLHYLRKPNGGLSSARNAGIDYVLEQFPTVEALYLLDADNRLHPGAVSRAWSTLREADADWLYPGIYTFGVRHKFDYEGAYSLLTNLAENTCEAGSLVKRHVFEHGLRFDESMKKGYEDWDFWLACAAAGFRGKADNSLGLLYRKRAESMLRDSARDHEEIMAYMRSKWKKLFHPRSILNLECDEAPRFGYLPSDEGSMSMATDPMDLVHGESAKTEFLRDLVAFHQAPRTRYFPPFLVFGDPRVVEELSRSGLLRTVFWLAEKKLDNKHGVFVSVHHDAEGIRFVEADALERRESLLFVTTKLFLECAMDSSLEWARKEFSRASASSLNHVVLRMPLADQGLRSAHRHHAGRLCIDYLEDLRDAAGGALLKPLEGERPRSIAVPSDRYKQARQLVRAAPLYPIRRSKGSKPRVGFVVPLASYGGVEQVAYSMAREFRAHGYETRLVVAGGEAFLRTSRNVDCFDEISILPEPELLSWDGTSTDAYMGQRFLPSQNMPLKHVRGLLLDLDVLVNCHASNINGLMGELRRTGCVTVSSVHVLDKTAFGRHVGHPYFSLAYEHAYDLFAPCSEGMGAWLRGMGVPAEKVVPVPNAADIEPLARVPRSGPLRVLVLGRFDYQKGLDRLEAVIRRVQSKGVEVEWKVIGSAVLDGLKAHMGLASVPGVSISPPVYSREGLAQLLAQSDVLLLLSRWEGLPLTLLEAMRCGVVPVTTDVGAIREVISEGVNGCLLNESQPASVLADEAANLLAKFAENPEALMAMSAAAVSTAGARHWTKACEPLIQRCDALRLTRN